MFEDYRNMPESGERGGNGMSKNVHEVDAAEFKKLAIDSGNPVVVDFWAGWCGPCRMMAPIFEDAAGELEGKVTFVKVDVDQNPDLAAAYRVQAIPTLVMLAGGEEKARFMGVLPKERLLSAIEENLGATV